MRLWNAQVYAAAVLVCGLTATNVNADPITTNLFYTTSAGPPSFGAVNVAGVTLGPSDCPFTACPLQLTINSITPLASLNGAHGIVFAPDGNHLLIAGGRTDPVHVHEIKLNGVFVGDGILPPGNTAYHLALGPAPLPFTGTVLRVECNSDCGPHYSRFLPLGSPITTGPMAESVEVFGPPGPTAESPVWPSTLLTAAHGITGRPPMGVSLESLAQSLSARAPANYTPI